MSTDGSFPAPVMAEFSPLQQMLCSYAPGKARSAAAWIIAFDNRMASILRAASEPILGQLRLSWWRDALRAASTARPKGENLLNRIGDLEAVYPALPDGAVRIVDGWEVLLTSEHLDDNDLESYARGRGAGLFHLIAMVAGEAGADGLERAGKSWALWDLACHVSDGQARQRAFDAAIGEWGGRPLPRWPRALRPLSMLVMLMRSDLDAGEPGHGQRRTTWFRLVWHGLTGH